jgi:hypothetical protein
MRSCAWQRRYCESVTRSPKEALTTIAACIRAIAKIAGVSVMFRLTRRRDAVEQTFNRLALIVQGRPKPRDSIPTDARLCATLRVWRECMHLDYASIGVRP